MMKFFKISLFFCLSLFLCGCNPVEDSNHITFSTWGSQSEIKVVKALIKQYEQINNIQVKLIHIPQNYFQKLHLLFASNQAPDVAFINNYYLPVYQEADLLLDLSPYFLDELKSDLYFNNAIKSLSKGNSLYAVPRDVSNIVVYYNKDMFKRYGISYPNENWTYDDLIKLGKQFSNGEQWAVGIEENPLFWEPVLWSNDATIFDENGVFVLNNQNSKQALKYFIDLKNKYKIIPPKSITANRTMAQLFLDEKVAMHFSGRWLVPKYRQEAKFDWDVVSIPRGVVGSVSGSDSSGWAISKNSKNIDLAISFVKYMSSKEVVSEVTKSGLITPARKDVAYSDVFLDGKKPKNVKTFLKINNNAKINTIPKNYNKKIEKLMKILEPYFLGVKNITSDTKFEL